MRKLLGMASMFTMLAWLVLIVPTVAAQSGSTVVTAAADGSFSVSVEVTNHDTSGFHNFNFDCVNETGLTARPSSSNKTLGAGEKVTITCKGKLNDGAEEGTFDFTIIYVNSEGRLTEETLKYKVRRS
jgi:hypothetical protein